eukprot:4037819-Pleurochrysis_carterae.AAC.1
MSDDSVLYSLHMCSANEGVLINSSSNRKASQTPQQTYAYHSPMTTGAILRFTVLCSTACCAS